MVSFGEMSFLMDLLMAFTAILAVLQVVLSSYGHYFRHPALRFFLWGASAIFIPLTAAIISSFMGKTKCSVVCEDYDCLKQHECIPSLYMTLLLIWAILIQIIKGNADMASAAVATEASPTASDGIGGQKARSSVEHLAYSIWTAGLVSYYVISERYSSILLLTLPALYVTKTVLKFIAFQRARDSFALGQNVKLIAGYMTQLHEQEELEDEQVVPRYIVMGENKTHLEESPAGYRIKRSALDDNAGSLVSLDRICHLSSSGDPLFSSQPKLRDLCLSFSMFKILRRRFAGYPLVEAGSNKPLAFVLQGMLGDKEDHKRVFRILMNELAFASDFYYSSLPWSFFGGWIAILNFFISLLIFAGLSLLGVDLYLALLGSSFITMSYFVITCIFTIAVVVTELWEMIFSACSKWTKLALLGYYIKHVSCFHHRRFIRKALSMALHFKAARRFSDILGQNSMLDHCRFHKHHVLLPKKMFHCSSLVKYVKIPNDVKAAIVRSLRRSRGQLSNGIAVVRQSEGCDNIIWACSGEGIADLILVWHIATSLFEMKYQPPSAMTEDMIVATSLSRYCAYLVAAAPDLLPDSVVWTESLYKAVMEDLQVALRKCGSYLKSGTTHRYDNLVKFASDSTNKVLRNGLKLAMELVEKVEIQEIRDEAPTWKLLAEFWSEMMLYAAPSDNVNGHLEALARGGEFITVLWAYLLHAGITSRPNNSTQP